MYSSGSSKQRRGSSFMDTSNNNEGSGNSMPHRDGECLSALQFGTVRSTSSSTGCTVDCLLTTSTRECWRSGSKAPSDENPEEVLCTFETPVNLDSLFIAVENDKKATQVPSKIDVYVATGTDGWSLSGSVNFKDATPTRDFPNHFCTRKITACLDVTKVLLRMYCSKGNANNNNHPSNNNNNAPFSITHLKAFGKPSLGGKGTFVHNSTEEMGGPMPRHLQDPTMMMMHQYDGGHMIGQQQQQPMFKNNNNNMMMMMNRQFQQQQFQLGGGSHHLHHERHQQPPRQLAALPPTSRAQSDPGAGGDYYQQQHQFMHPQRTGHLHSLQHHHHQLQHHQHQQLPASAGHVPRAYLRPDVLPGRTELAPIQKPRPYSDDGAGYRHHQNNNNPQPPIGQSSDLRERTMELLRGQQQQQFRESPQPQESTVMSHSNESTDSNHQSIRVAEKCYSILIQKKARALEADDLDVAEKLHDLLSKAVSLRAQISDLEMRKRHAVGVDDYRTAKECKSRIANAVLQVESLLEEITKPQPPPLNINSNRHHPAASQHTGEDGISSYNPTSARDPIAASSPPSSIGPSISVVVQNEHRSPLPSPGRHQHHTTPPSSPPRSPRRVVESPSPAPLSSRMSVCGSEQRHQAPPSEIRSRAPKPDQQHPTHKPNEDEEQLAVVPVQKPKTIDVVTVDIEHMDTLDDVPPPPIFASSKSIQSLTSPKNNPNHSLKTQHSAKESPPPQQEDADDEGARILKSEPSVVVARPFLTHLRKRIVVPDPVSDDEEEEQDDEQQQHHQQHDQSDSNKEYTLVITPVNQHHPVPIAFPTPHCWDQEDPMMVFIYAYLEDFCAADSSELSAEKMIEESLAGVVNSGGDAAGDDTTNTTTTITTADRALVRSSHLIVEVSSLTGWNLIEFTFGLEGSSCLFTRVHPKVREAAVMSLLDGDVVTSILSNGAGRGITDQTFQEALIFYISGHNSGFGVLDPVATIFLANMQHFDMLRHLQRNKHLSPSKKNLKVLVGSLAGRMGEANARLRTVASTELVKSAEMILPEDLRGDGGSSSSEEDEEHDDDDVPTLDSLSGANVLESVAYAVAIGQHPDGDKNKGPLTNANFAINRLTTITSLLEVFVNYCYANRDAQLAHGTDSVFRAIQSPMRNGPNKQQQQQQHHSSPTRVLSPGLDAIFDNYFPSLYPPLLLTNLITPLINHRTESVRKAAVVLLAKIWSLYVVFPHIQKSVHLSTSTTTSKSRNNTIPPPRSQSAIESIVKSLKPTQKKQFDALVKEASDNLTSSDEEEDENTPSAKRAKDDDDDGDDWGIKAAPVVGAKKLPPPPTSSSNRGVVDRRKPQSLGNSNSGGGGMGSSSLYSSSTISNLNFTQNAKGGFMEQLHKTDSQIDMEMRAYAKTKRKTVEETLIENPSLAEDFYFGIGKDVLLMKKKDENTAVSPKEKEQNAPPSPPFTNETALAAPTPVDVEDEEKMSEQDRLMQQRRLSVRKIKVISSQPLGHHESVSNPGSAINSPLVSVRVGGNNGDNIDDNNNPPDNVDYNEVAADSNNTPAQYESFSNSGELSTPTTQQQQPTATTENNNKAVAAVVPQPVAAVSSGGGIHRSASNIRRERIVRELEAELNLGSPLAPHYSESPESCKVKKDSAYSDAVNPMPPRRPAPVLTPGQCQYCGVQDQEFNTRSGLQDHFKYECVLLTPCPLCMKSVEIRDIHTHMTHDCTLRGRVRQCPKCLEAVASSEFVSHVNENTCSKFQLDVIKCALCSVVVPDTEAAWRDHLAGANPCKENPRSVLTDENLLKSAVQNSPTCAFEARDEATTLATVPVTSCTNSPMSPSLGDSTRRKKNVSFGDEMREVQHQPPRDVTDDAAAIRIQALHRGRMARRTLRGVTTTPPPEPQQRKEAVTQPARQSSPHVAEDAAAVRIQALHRGRMARRGLRAVTKTPPPESQQEVSTTPDQRDQNQPPRDVTDDAAATYAQPAGIYAGGGGGGSSGLYGGSSSYLDFSIAGEHSANKELYEF